MRRLVGLLIILFGASLVAFGLFSWDSMFDTAFRQGGVAVTGIFFILLLAGGIGLIVAGAVIIKRRGEMDPYNGVRLEREGYDDDDDD